MLRHEKGKSISWNLSEIDFPPTFPFIRKVLPEFVFPKERKVMNFLSVFLESMNQTWPKGITFPTYFSALIALIQH